MMTLKIIAEKAGVSIMTVSNVLNGKGKVSPEKRSQIAKLLSEGGYELRNPDSLAKKRKCRRIRLYCAELKRLSTDLFFNALLMGILTITSESVYDVVVSPVEKDADGKYRIHTGPEPDMDGMIIINPRENEDFLKDAVNSRIPFVIVGRPASRLNVNYVDVDNAAIGYNSTTYLIERGHRDILFLTGPADYTVSVDKIEGYRLALRTHDIDPKCELLLSSEYSIESARDSVSEALRSEGSFTAIVANSDQLAVGAVNALALAGLRVPQDISLLCGSESLLTTSHVLSISGIDTNSSQTGEQAARMIIEIIERRLIKPTHVHIPFYLNERGSVLSLQATR